MRDKPASIKNFNVEAFNNDVNHSGNLDAKYRAWAQHRARVTDWVLDAAAAGKAKSLLILGAGECNDINLNALTVRFDSVTLTDVDTKSVLEGVRRQKLSKQARQKLVTQKAEYTGLAQSRFFEKLTEQVNAGAVVEALIGTIKKQIKNLPPTEPMGQQMYDCVLSLPVYTQLVYTQVEMLTKLMVALNRYTQYEIDKVLVAAQALMPVVLNRYNALLLQNVHKGGCVVVASDILEMPAGVARVEKATALVKVGDAAALHAMIAADGLPWAVQGFAGLAQKIKPAKTHYSIWAFDKYKTYLVKGITAKA